MIDTRELRIGNLVTDILGTSIHKVDSINQKGIDLYIEDDGNWPELAKTWIEAELKEENIFPIPLTEEWLLKFGFHQLPHFTVMNSFIIDIGRNRKISVGCVGTPNLSVWIQEMEGDKVTDIVCLHNWDYDKEMYVHQLQNIYFCITKQELTIKK